MVCAGRTTLVKHHDRVLSICLTSTRFTVSGTLEAVINTQCQTLLVTGMLFIHGASFLTVV